MTDKEIRDALRDKTDQNTNCFWFRRNIQDLEGQEKTKMFGRYKGSYVELNAVFSMRAVGKTRVSL